MSKSQVVTVAYLLADTRHPIRGVRFTPRLLKSAAARFRSRPLYRNHRSSVIGRTLTCACIQCDDGEWELRGTAEIHVPEGESLEDFAGKGMSMSLIAYGRPLSGNEAVIIAAEPGHFDSETIADADRELSRLVPGRVTEYYQFSEIPPPTVVIVLLDKLVDLLLGSSATLITMGIAELVAERFSKSKTEPDEEVQIRIGLRDEEPAAVIDVSMNASYSEVKQKINDGLQTCVPRLEAARAARRRGKKKP